MFNVQCSMKSWRSYFLVITAIGTNLAIVYALLVPDAGNSAVADFKFPQSIQFKLGKAIQSNQESLKTDESKLEVVKAHQQYRYTPSAIDLEMRYIVNTAGDVDTYLQEYTAIAPENIEAKQVKLSETGYYTLLNSEDRAYLSSCISPRSLSNVTPKQFSQYRYQNDLNLKTGWDWLRGKASIRDRRCLWVHLSTPIVSDPQAAYESLETTWSDVYHWWLPNFPAIRG